MSTVYGPFGRYEHGSGGAVFNSLYCTYRVPLTMVENVVLGYDSSRELGTILYKGEVVAYYNWFEGITHAVVRFSHKEWRIYGSQNEWILMDNGEPMPKFKVTLSGNNLPCFEIEGDHATENLYHFLTHPMLSVWMDHPCYQLSKNAGAFFQGGFGSPKGKWFMIEFWKPSGVQAWMDYLNEHYRHQTQEIQ